MFCITPLVSLPECHAVHGPACWSLCCCLQGGFPDLRVMLCIGGIDMRSQMDVLKRGVHIVVATPGRLKDLLTKRRMNLDICRWGAGRGVQKMGGSTDACRLAWLQLCTCREFYRCRISWLCCRPTG
jgi:hypothetical protein